jgi:hypothetical protein
MGSGADAARKSSPGSTSPAHVVIFCCVTRGPAHKQTAGSGRKRLALVSNVSNPLRSICERVSIRVLRLCTVECLSSVTDDIVFKRCSSLQKRVSDDRVTPHVPHCLIEAINTPMSTLSL